MGSAAVDVATPASAVAAPAAATPAAHATQSRQVKTPENDNLKALIAQGLPQGLPKDVVSTITKVTAQREQESIPGLGQAQQPEQPKFMRVADSHSTQVGQTAQVDEQQTDSGVQSQADQLP